MPRSVGPPRVVNVEDLHQLAKRHLPRAVFDYIDNKTDAELTLRENVRTFEQIQFRPRCAMATPAADLRTTVLDKTLELPFLLGPVNSSRLFYPRGESVTAREADAAGT